MDAVSNQGDLLEVAKRKAREIAQGYKQSDLFQLLTNDFKGHSQRLISRDEFLEQLDNVKSAAASRSLPDIMLRQRDAFESADNNQKNNIAYLISDFQKSICKLQDIENDSNILTYFIPVTATKNNNAFIDTCYFIQPFIQLNTPVELIVKLQNSGDEAVENIPVSLAINDVQRAVTSVNLQAHSFSEVKLSFTLQEAGWKNAEVSITDYPVTFDNSYHLAFQVRPFVNVLCINQSETNSYIQALFADDSYFKVTNSNVNQVDYSAFSTQQIILLNGVKTISTGFADELEKYISQGGSVIVFPSEEADLSSYQVFLTSCKSNYFTSLLSSEEKVAKIETGHALLQQVFENKKSLPENVDLPLVHKYYSMSRIPSYTSESVLTLASGNSLFSATEFGKGNLYLFSVPANPDFSNLPYHALFVPLVLKATLLASSEITSPFILGQDQMIEIKNTTLSGDNIFHLKNSKLKFDIVPESRVINNIVSLNVHDQVNQSGTYELTAGNQMIGLNSFNYDRHESDLECFSAEELTEAISKYKLSLIQLIEPSNTDLGHTVAELNEGKKLWKHCVLAALLFLAAEILLIRFMKPR